ncbi:MAG: VCBS repeat-containing protein [Candidatus Latescibacteria bacterium]|nr:VCBS repeat-containing protein [Candidatus Latescibacterota bacterium]
MEIVWTLLLTGMALLSGDFAWASPEEDAQVLSTRFGAFQAFADSSGIVYGDDRGFLRVLERKEGGYEQVWKSEPLGSAIGGVFVLDVNLDGREEIVTYTSGGKMLYFDAQSRRIVWEIQRERFEAISAMTLADIDRDAQMELIFCADGRLYIYDGKTQFEEWASDQMFTAEEIVVGDVDGDGDEEIVLNTGVVLDAQFHDLEWQSPERFGDRIALSDIDGDGIPELIAESGGRFLKIWDLDLRRMKW